MHPGDAAAQRVNPVFRLAEEQHVADVKIGLDARRIHFVDKACHFQGRDQEIVPDVFQRDGDALFLGVRRQCTDRLLRPLVGVGIADVVVSAPEAASHRARHDENCVHAQRHGAVDLRADDAAGLFPHRGIGSRQGIGPVKAGSQRGQDHALLLRQGAQFLCARLKAVQGECAVLVKRRLETLEPRALGRQQARLRRHVRRKRPLIDRLNHR